MWFKRTFPKRAKYLEENEHVDFKKKLKELELTEREWLEKQIDYYTKCLTNFKSDI